MTAAQVGVIQVAFDMTFPNRNQAGSGQYARSLLAAVRAREDISVLEVAGPRRSGIAGTLRWMIRGAGSAVGRSPASLLHCPAFVTPWNVPRPVVISVLDLATRRFPQDHPLEWRLYESRLLPAQARKAAMVIAISENTRRDVVAEYGVAADRTVTIHPGVDPLFARSGGAPTPSGDPVLLFPGAPVARKNLGIVLRVLAAAPPESALHRSTLLISGATAERFPAHAAAIASAGLGPKVRWLGQVPRERMPALMAEATAVVYPSLYEGFGFPPLEAMAAGTPVVASSAPCLPEVLGDAALLVDPADEVGLARALEAVLTRADLRARLVEAGRKRAASFTWEGCAARTVEAYRQVLGLGK